MEAITKTAVKKKRPYLYEVDFMRLFFICGVLFNHSINVVLDAMSTTGWASTSLSDVRLMFHYSRNGFLFMSGLVLAMNYYKRHEWGRFYKKRFGGSLGPYLAWNLIFLILYTSLGGGSTGQSFGLTYLDDIVHGGHYYMYYMLLVMQLYLVFPGIVWLFQHSQHHLRLLGVSFVVQLAIDAWIKFQLEYLNLAGWPYWFRHFNINIFVYEFYIIFGVYTALHYREVSTFIDRHIKVIAASALALCLGTVAYLRWWNMGVLHMSYDFATSPHQPYMQVFDAVMIVTVFWLGQRYAKWRAGSLPPELAQNVKTGAKISFGMYLNQSFCLYLLGRFLGTLTVNDGTLLAILPVGYGVVLTLSVAVAYFCYRVAPFGWLIGRPQWHPWQWLATLRQPIHAEK
ncbi:acyltransferase [Levilactobacillus cerevisiae]|uniref:acyltransferase n=1 Tax=Levilactobacillus cerevisiae TaxID=1704076 RepID=UPI001CDB5F96|nr:acyltransferase [Levilactobacillus cerevisiae]